MTKEYEKKSRVKQYIKYYIGYKKSEKVQKGKILTTPITALLVLSILVILFNQYQIRSISDMMQQDVTSGEMALTTSTKELKTRELSNLNFGELKSTGHKIAAVFPV